VFLLWGNYARQKASIVTAPQHLAWEAGPPVPDEPAGFSARRPFSQCNAGSRRRGLVPTAGLTCSPWIINGGGDAVLRTVITRHVRIRSPTLDNPSASGSL
jgi:hypothetical protein